MNFVNSDRQFSEFSTPQKKQFKVDALFADITAIVKADWKNMSDQQSEIELTSSINAPTLSIHADRQMIEHILINLLQNSEHALRGSEEQKIRLGGGINKYGHVTLDVSDTGIGITEEVGSKIFVPFYTTRKVHIGYMK
jgi:two-component system nitrogen regulation sensor histidine kinase NtrY